MLILIYLYLSFFFFNDTATTEIYTLSLHDALPISALRLQIPAGIAIWTPNVLFTIVGMVLLVATTREWRSEEHTSELQSQSNLVCRLLLEKKKKNTIQLITKSMYLTVLMPYSLPHD